jgi:hypothetical protein
MTPEHFTDDIQAIIDAAETGDKGCLLPEREDPGEGGDDDDEGE